MRDPPPFEPRESGNFRLSPDESRIAVSIRDEDGSHIWVYDIRTRGKRQLTEEDGRSPVWSHDGEWLYFRSNRRGVESVWKMQSDGSDQVLVTEEAQSVRSISSDNTKLTAIVTTSDGWDMAILDVTKDPPEVQKIRANRHDEIQHRYSPDDRCIAYQSNETGETRIYVFDISTGLHSSIASGIRPTWSKDGKQIFFVRAGRMFSVDVATQPQFKQLTQPVELFEFPPASHSGFDVTEDGERFLMAFPSEFGELGDRTSTPHIEVTVNWFKELNRLVPIK